MGFFAKLKKVGKNTKRVNASGFVGVSNNLYGVGEDGYRFVNMEEVKTDDGKKVKMAVFYDNKHDDVFMKPGDLVINKLGQFSMVNGGSVMKYLLDADVTLADGTVGVIHFNIGQKGRNGTISMHPYSTKEFLAYFGSKFRIDGCKLYDGDVVVAEGAKNVTRHFAYFLNSDEDFYKSIKTEFANGGKIINCNQKTVLQNPIF